MLKDDEHIFSTKINQALNDAQVSRELFQKWQIEVTQDFIEKNYMSLPENMIKGDIRVDARNMISYLRKIEGNTNAMYVALVKFKGLFLDVKKSLATVEERQLAANAQVIELTHSVNRLTSVIQNLYERMSTQSPERYLTSPPTLTNGSNLTITNGNNQSEEEQNIVKPWKNVVTTLDSCDIDSFVYEYLDSEVEKAYKKFKNNTTNKLRLKKTKYTKIYSTLKMCIPEDIEMVSEIKPTNSEMRLQWKLECMNVSKLCGQNAKKVFFASKCNGNFTKTCLNNNANINAMNEYIKENKGKEIKENLIVNYFEHQNEEKIMNV